MRRRRTLAGPLDPHCFYWPVVVVLALFVLGHHVLGHQTAASPPPATTTCRKDAKSVSSKTYVSPYVFEGSVVPTPQPQSDYVHQVQGGRDRHRVTFRVDRVHKGDPSRVLGAQKQISLHFWSRSAQQQDVDDDDGDINRCFFRPDIFKSRRKFIVFAADASSVKNARDHVTTTRRITTLDEDGDDEDVVADDLWRGGQAPTEIPTFFVFCEPVALNKKSSRRIQKILRRAKPPTVSGLKDVTVRLHKRLKLVCRAKGRPAPTVTWFKDGRPLVENSKVIVRFNRSVSQLMIRNALEDDGGLYECRATIDATGLSSAANATVTVKKRGRSVVSSSPKNSTPKPPKSDRKGFGDTYTGKECPVQHFCQNNSTCVFIENLGEAYCRCVDGFVGGRCEHKNVFFVLGEVKQMDWTYHKNILTVVVILGVLLSITILSNVTYFIFRAKRKIQKEKKKVPTDGGGGGGGDDERLSTDVVGGGSFIGISGGGAAIEMQQHVVSNSAEIVRDQNDFYVSDDPTRPRSTSLQPPDKDRSQRVRASASTSASSCSAAKSRSSSSSKWTQDRTGLGEDPPLLLLQRPCCLHDHHHHHQDCHSRHSAPQLDRCCSVRQPPAAKSLSPIRRLHRLNGVSDPKDLLEMTPVNYRPASHPAPAFINIPEECSRNDDNDDDDDDDDDQPEPTGNSRGQEEQEERSFLRTTTILN